MLGTVLLYCCTLSTFTGMHVYCINPRYNCYWIIVTQLKWTRHFNEWKFGLTFIYLVTHLLVFQMQNGCGLFLAIIGLTSIDGTNLNNHVSRPQQLNIDYRAYTMCLSDKDNSITMATDCTMKKHKFSMFVHWSVLINVRITHDFSLGGMLTNLVRSLCNCPDR